MQSVVREPLSCARLSVIDALRYAVEPVRRYRGPAAWAARVEALL